VRLNIQLSESHGFRSLLVTFPPPIAMEKFSPRSSYPAKALTLAGQEGIPFIDLEPSFRAAYHGHDSLFVPYDGDHPNAFGHDLAARAIVEHILSGEGVRPPSPVSVNRGSLPIHRERDHCGKACAGFTARQRSTSSPSNLIDGHQDGDHAGAHEFNEHRAFS